MCAPRNQWRHRCCCETLPGPQSTSATRRQEGGRGGRGGMKETGCVQARVEEMGRESKRGISGGKERLPPRHQQKPQRHNTSRHLHQPTPPPPPILLPPPSPKPTHTADGSTYKVVSDNTGVVKAGEKAHLLQCLCQFALAPLYNLAQGHMQKTGGGQGKGGGGKVRDSIEGRRVRR